MCQVSIMTSLVGVEGQKSLNALFTHCCKQPSSLTLTGAVNYETCVTKMAAEGGERSYYVIENAGYPKNWNQFTDLFFPEERTGTCVEFSHVSDFLILSLFSAGGIRRSVAFLPECKFVFWEQSFISPSFQPAALSARDLPLLSHKVSPALFASQHQVGSFAHYSFVMCVSPSPHICVYIICVTESLSLWLQLRYNYGRFRKRYGE